MSAYEVTFDRNPRTTVTIDVPEGADPFDHIATQIARELGILRFEVQIGEHGGAIRMIGDDGPGISFTISQAAVSA